MEKKNIKQRPRKELVVWSWRGQNLWLGASSEEGHPIPRLGPIHKACLSASLGRSEETDGTFSPRGKLRPGLPPPSSSSQPASFVQHCPLTEELPEATRPL